MNRKKDHGIEALRWISILAVVLHHGISRQRQSSETIDQILLLKDWLEWCVPAFFYVSGLLFVAPRATGLLPFLAHRARRLLVPYLVVSTIAFVGLWTLHSTGLWKNPNPQDLEPGHLLHQLVWLTGVGPQMYFLPYLYLVGAVTAILALAIPARWLSTAAAGLILLSAFGWLMPHSVLGAGFERAPAFLFAFCMGVSDRVSASRFRTTLLVATVLGLACLAGFAGEAWPLSLAAPPLLYRIIRSLPIHHILGWLEKLGSPGAIFLWHAPIIQPAASLLLGALGILDWWNYLAAAVLACALSLGIDRVIARVPILNRARL